MLLPDTNVKRWGMLVTEMAKNVTNIFKIVTKTIVTNIDVAHGNSRFLEFSLPGEPYLYLPNLRTFLGSSSVGVFDFVFEDFAALLPRPLSLPFPLLFALSGFSCFSSAINSFSFSFRSTLSSSARFGSSFMGLQSGA